MNKNFRVQARTFCIRHYRKAQKQFRGGYIVKLAKRVGIFQRNNPHCWVPKMARQPIRDLVRLFIKQGKTTKTKIVPIHGLIGLAGHLLTQLTMDLTQGEEFVILCRDKTKKTIPFALSEYK
ncbi:hypothetical protein A3780_11705 [Kosakonia radicincitans]|nr:hypothetical protein A3780_11705 [Kosakonia radicincitans]